MPQKINDRYRSAAEEFARRVTAALGEQVDSLVLFGSVARGEAKRDSDVDILIISSEPTDIRESLSEIRSEFAYERDYTSLISMVHFGREEFFHLISMGSPFIKTILEEGDILYDNGTFARVRRETVAAS